MYVLYKDAINEIAKYEDKSHIKEFQHIVFNRKHIGYLTEEEWSRYLKIMKARYTYYSGCHEFYEWLKVHRYLIERR